MYIFTVALKNILRQHKRYKLFIPLLIVISMLVGGFTKVAMSCRSYADTEQSYSITVSQQEMDIEITKSKKVNELEQTAVLLMIGCQIVGAMSMFYISSNMIRERLSDIGIMLSVGVTKRQIILSLFIEIFFACCMALIIGISVGCVSGEIYLTYRINSGDLPSELKNYVDTGVAGIDYAVSVLCIVLIPMIQLAVSLYFRNPVYFLHKRK